MQSFYEPNYANGKPIRCRIQRTDAAPIAVASIWERFIDRSSGEIVFSFSMLTVAETGHPVMQQLHGPEDEKRSIVVLQDADYCPWLRANQEQAGSLLKLSQANILECEPAPR